MIPERLKNRTHPLSEQRKPKHERAAEDRHRHFQPPVNAQRSPPLQRPGCGNSTSEREARHEAGQNQCRSPNRIAESQSAQPEPESLKKKRAASGEKKNDRDNGGAHGPKRAMRRSALQSQYFVLRRDAADFVRRIQKKGDLEGASPCFKAGSPLSRPREDRQGSVRIRVRAILHPVAAAKRSGELLPKLLAQASTTKLCRAPA